MFVWAIVAGWGYAAVYDWRTLHAPDWVWVFLSLVGAWRVWHYGALADTLPVLVILAIVGAVFAYRDGIGGADSKAMVALAMTHGEVAMITLLLTPVALFAVQQYRDEDFIPFLSALGPIACITAVAFL